MADIFISYAREDRPRAETLARALETQGWSIWWDVVIPAGRTFDEVIDEALDSARCVLVLWSSASVESRYVRGEAQDADERRILVPVVIENDIRIPRAFRAIQAADLVNWDGTPTARSFLRLTDDIARLVGPPPVVEREARREREKRQAEERERARQTEEQQKVREAEVGTRRRAEAETRRHADSIRKQDAETSGDAPGAGEDAVGPGHDVPEAGTHEARATVTRGESTLFTSSGLYSVLQKRVGLDVGSARFLLTTFVSSVAGTLFFLCLNAFLAGRPDLILGYLRVYPVLVPVNFVASAAALQIVIRFVRQMREPTTSGRLLTLLLADVALAPLLWFLAVAILYPITDATGGFNAASFSGYMKFQVLIPDDDTFIAWACLTPVTPILAHGVFTALLLLTRSTTRPV